MSMVDEIAGYLHTIGHGTLATDLFKRQAPDDPSLMTCVMQLGGDAPGLVHNTAIVDTENPMLEVWTRADNPEVAEARLNIVYLELMKIRNQTINGTLYVSVVPDAAPTIVDRDENGRFIARCDFMVRKELSQ